MSSSTSDPGYSDPAVARDAEQLPPGERELLYGRGLLLLWVGVVGGPAIWFADQQVGYWLVYHGCHTQSLVPLYVETAVAWVLAAGAGLLSWRFVRQFTDASTDGGQADDRAHFLALVGVGLSVLSLLTIIAATIPRLALHPCP